VETLAADFRFSVVTSALDGPADRPMESVRPDRWSSFGHATTWYELSHHMRTWKTVILLRQTRPQVVYLNSLFDYRFTVLPLLLTRVTSRRTPVLLAPRGELSAGALGLKRWKKRLFLAVFRLLRLHKTVTWHASTGLEQADIERVFGPDVRSQIAVNMRANISCADQDRADHATGASGGRSLVFMSRIVPNKNVATLIRALPLVKGGARLSIAGPIEDVRYWAKCTELIGGLDDPDMARYVGTVPPDQAVSFLGGFDLFVLPTWGENFGHVVLESLAAGTPVIVGRDSPWHRVESAGAGWLCDPASPAEVAGLIQRFLDLDEESRGRMRQAACRVADQVQNNPEKVEVNRAMFRALSRGVPR
jgi:glycosyltransferase involved in cell wall biosynthesis